MKRIMAWFAYALVALFGMTAVQAAEQTHTVKAGETLGTIAGKNWKAVCELNQLKDCNRIFVGQKLKLVAVAPQASAAASTKGKPCITLGVAPWNKSHTMKLRLQGIDTNPRLTSVQKEEAKRLVQTNAGEKRDITADMVWAAMPFRSGGKVKFAYDKPVCTGTPQRATFWTLSDGTVIGEPAVCGNIGPVKLSVKAAPSPASASSPAPVVVSVPAVAGPKPISAIPAKNIGREIAEYEAIAGVGVWDNHLAHGNWQYGEASIMAILPDGYRLGAGVYGMWGGGASDNSAYTWKEHGWGPQLVLKKNFLKEHTDQFGQTVEYPAMWGVKLRYIGNDYVSGGNPESGYRQTQRGKKYGVFAEYNERTSLDWMWGVTGEGWKSFDRQITSTWSGDKPQDRGSWALNVYAQQRWNDDWQGRYVAGVSHQNWDGLNYLNLQAEARYKETVMCGPRISLALNKPETYRDVSKGDLTTVGEFCRVETFGIIRTLDKQERTDAVQKVGTVSPFQAPVAVPVSSDKGGDQETERILRNIDSLGT